MSQNRLIEIASNFTEACQITYSFIWYLFRVITVSVNSAAFWRKNGCRHYQQEETTTVAIALHWPADSSPGNYSIPTCNSILKSVGCDINSHLRQSSLLTNTQPLPTANTDHCTVVVVSSCWYRRRQKAALYTETLITRNSRICFMWEFESCAHFF